MTNMVYVCFIIFHLTSGSGLYYVLPGQHLFAAASQVGDKLARRGRTVQKCVCLNGLYCGCSHVVRRCM